MAQTQSVLDPKAAGARRLEGRVAIITGGGQGHGRATARRFAQEGASLMLVDRHAPGAERTRDELLDFGTDADIFVAELGPWDTAVKLMEATKERFGKIDILVNNVGGAMYGGKSGWEFTPQELEDNINNNLYTCLSCCWAVMPYMIEQGSGSIINFGSHAVRGTARLGYAAAKGAVMAITTSLAIEAAPHGVRVNCLVPHLSDRDEGDTLVTRIPGQAPPSGSSKRDASSGLSSPHMTPIPMNRPGKPEEIAAVAAFLASDDSSFTTGDIICVGGGAFCRI